MVFGIDMDKARLQNLQDVPVRHQHDPQFVVGISLIVADQGRDPIQNAPDGFDSRTSVVGIQTILPPDGLVIGIGGSVQVTKEPFSESNIQLQTIDGVGIPEFDGRQLGGVVVLELVQSNG